MGMNIIIKIIGVTFILLGIGFMLKPQAIKWMMKFMKQGKRIYLAGLLRFALAIVFLLGAEQARKKWVIAALGIIFLLGGLLIFVLGPEKIRRMFDWYEKQSNLLFRFLAVVVIALGAVVIFAA